MQACAQPLIGNSPAPPGASSWAEHNTRYRRSSLYRQLIAGATGLPNAHALACMIASYYAGDGAMPPRLGLSAPVWVALTLRHFPTMVWLRRPAPRAATSDSPRWEEQEDLRELLLRHRASLDLREEAAIADILVTACMASDHLWQDLGLWQRADLSALIEHNFPALAAQNDRNMKWKKFFYKQLCRSAGVSVCRAPSCQVCADYAQCFGPEE